jgi:LacI family transcriptional regulator
MPQGTALHVIFALPAAESDEAAMTRLSKAGTGMPASAPGRSVPRGKVRIEEVALTANVSPATVSRVLNNPSLVSPELQKKVNQAARKLGYVADGAARALASRRSRALGAIVPNLSNTIFSDAIEAFQHRLEAENYTMLLANFDYDEDVEYRNVRTMIERGVDGLMLVGVTHSRPLYKLMEASSTPFVQTWAPRDASRYPTIGYDNAHLSRVVVDYIIGLGHRDIAVVAGDLRHNDRVASRITGIRNAFARHGLALPEDRIIHSEYRLDKVRQAFRELQGRGPLPTAIIANNDVVAIGLMLEAQAQGISVPEKLSIIGVGDLEIAGHLLPPLTTVRTPKRDIGIMAAEYLLARINNREFSIPAELPLELEVRGTTAAPPNTLRKD